MMLMTVKSEGSPSTITGFIVGTENLSAAPTTLRIYSNQSWDPLGSSSSTTLSTISSNAVIATDTATTFTLSADFPTGTSGWCVGRILGIRVEQDGISKDIPTPDGIYGPDRRFFGGIATWMMTAAPTTSTTSDQNGNTTSMTAVFTLQVEADGLDLAQPTGKDFVVTVNAGPNCAALCDSVVSTTIPSGPIADGSVKTITVTATILGAHVPGNGQYRFAIKQINWGSNPNAQISQYWGIEDFMTWTIAGYFDSSIPPARQIAAPFISASLYDNITVLGMADDFGQKSQMVGEGGFLRFTPLDIKPSQTIVFPYPASPDRGQVMRLSVSMNATDMTPMVMAPNNLLGSSQVGFRQYPVSNVANMTSGGVTTKTTFDVTVGEFIAHGKLVRTGDGSCMAVFYWGTGSTFDSAGEKMDLINMSPSPPEDGNLPVRFKLKCTSAGMHGNGNYYYMDVTSMPFSFKVQGSTDLVNWKELTYWSYSYDAGTMDETGSVQGSVLIDVSTLSTLNLNSARCSFRIVSLD
jgi:hypothetical protein